MGKHSGPPKDRPSDPPPGPQPDSDRPDPATGGEEEGDDGEE
ncbi:hypothetical protein [Spongiactinospora rosea]|nr:hypothetical protein [Spongiactinospora rosea]